MENGEKVLAVDYVMMFYSLQSIRIESRYCRAIYHSIESKGTDVAISITWQLEWY